MNSIALRHVSTVVPGPLAKGCGRLTKAFHQILLVLMAIAAVSSSLYGEQFTKIYSLPAPFVRAGSYDYEPTAIIDTNGYTRVWFCADDLQHGDSIFYSEAPPGSTQFSTPQFQMGWNSSYTPWPDDPRRANVACRPSVVRSIYDGTYRMFYECTIPHNHVVANICTAMSYDGYTWYVWNGSGWAAWSQALAQPILAAPGGTGGYGVGHPSVFISCCSSSGYYQYWLYYYYQYSLHGPSAMILTKSVDGINFDPGQGTDIQNTTDGVVAQFAPFVDSVHQPPPISAIYPDGTGSPSTGNYFFFADSRGLTFGASFPLSLYPMPEAVSNCAQAPAAIPRNIYGQVGVNSQGTTTLMLLSSEEYPTCNDASHVNRHIYPIMMYFQW